MNEVAARAVRRGGESCFCFSVSFGAVLDGAIGSSKSIGTAASA